MSRTNLFNQSAEAIKSHILDPDNSTLPEYLREQLDRVVSLSKVLAKNPIARNAIRLHLAKYPNIKQTTAYQDLSIARKLYNTYADFDYDFWITWTLEKITENIEKCRDSGTVADRKIIAQEHANLIRAIGTRPEEPVDPLRNEKHSFYVMVYLDGKPVKIDADALENLPVNTLRELNRALISGNEIDDQGAAEIMNS